ncbi:MAG: mechanosensitive ion channel family protein [Chloroflexi bacterium]|nr:mechanosensitive ion channel family protein [Chloroflexota bacterium]
MLPEAFADNAAFALFYALGVIAASCTIAFLANLILGQVLNLLVKRHESPLRSIEIRIIGALRLPAALVIILIGTRLALTSLSQASTRSLGFISNLDQLGHTAWLVAVAALVCYAISRLIRAIMRWYSARVPHDTRTALNTAIWPILIRISSIFVFALGTLVVLDILGIPITPLLAGLGIGGLAVALAISPTIASFIAGTYVVAEGNISEGDYVEIDAERAGFVTSIGWRSTVLRSRFNNMIVVPNNLITESIVTNYTTPTPAITGIVECGVSYDSDLKKVEQVSLEVARQVVEESDDANKEFEPLFRFFEFADSNINFRIIFQGADRVAMFAIQHEIIMRLHARFNEEGIEINYPVRKLTTVLPDEDLPSPLKEAGELDSQAESVPAASTTDDC